MKFLALTASVAVLAILAGCADTVSSPVVEGARMRGDGRKGCLAAARAQLPWSPVYIDSYWLSEVGTETLLRVDDTELWHCTAYPDGRISGVRYLRTVPPKPVK